MKTKEIWKFRLLHALHNARTRWQRRYINATRQNFAVATCNLRRWQMITTTQQLSSSSTAVRRYLVLEERGTRKRESTLYFAWLPGSRGVDWTFELADKKRQFCKLLRLVVYSTNATNAQLNTIIVHIKYVSANNFKQKK